MIFCVAISNIDSFNFDSKSLPSGCSGGCPKRIGDVIIMNDIVIMKCLIVYEKKSRQSIMMKGAQKYGLGLSSFIAICAFLKASALPSPASQRV